MQLLRESWLTVRESPFHTLTKKELIDECNMPNLDARILPLEKWLNAIGEAYASLEPQKSSALKGRVSHLEQKTQNVFLKLDEDKTRVFRFGIFFAAYGAIFLEDEKLANSATKLCAKVKVLEEQAEAAAADKKLEETVRILAELYEEFLKNIILCAS